MSDNNFYGENEESTFLSHCFKNSRFRKCVVPTKLLDFVVTVVAY